MDISRFGIRAASLNVLFILLLLAVVGWRYVAGGSPPESLQGRAAPLPENLDDFVSDRAAAIQLGKALFWDMQLGADGVQTCASCHFNAGADSRIRNQMRPAGKDDPEPVFSFGGPNYTYAAGDFPFPRSANEVSGSQGTFHTQFLGTTPGAGEDNTQVEPDPIFNVGGVNTRQVAFRNAPTVVNAIFNFRNLWDGRVNHRFNGRSPFGPRDGNARIWMRSGATVWAESMLLENASMASVAVGPPVDVVEVSSVGRTWPFIGKRLLPLRALAKQEVDPTDSHLAGLRHPSRGLALTYGQMVQRAYHPHLWGNEIVRTEQHEGTNYTFTQTEENFSLYAGLAIMLYVSTQISDEAPYDDYAQGNPYALTDQEADGLDIFLNKGRCIDCHAGPDFTNAGLRAHEAADSDALVNTFRRRDGRVVLYDRGFFNIGLRLHHDDHGLGRDDDFGNDLSFAEQYAQDYRLDPFEVDPSTFDEPLYGDWPAVAVEGAIKTPGLRNIELTAPYMRNGSMATLRQVVDFFDRGGEFVAQNDKELHPSVRPLYLSEYEKDALVAFLLTLTDERVRFHRAPFDHPQIFVPNGHEGSAYSVTDDGSGRAVTDMVEIPAVGRAGYAYLPSQLALFNEQLGLSHFDAGAVPPTPTDALCYLVADNDDAHDPSHDVLTLLPNGSNDADVLVGATGTAGIEAAAFNPWTRTLYAADRGTLGTINLGTGRFEAIGPVGSGSGYDAHGVRRTREFLDVDGLAFDPAAGGYGIVLYGVVRKTGEADLLIAIDPATGSVVKDAFGNGVDYVTLRGVNYLTDVDDLAISPWDGTMYAVNNRDGQGSRLVTINRWTGVASDVLDLPVENVEGLGFFGDGTLFATAGEGTERLVVIDPATRTATLRATLGAGGRDYEAVDCLTNHPNYVSVRVFADANGDGTMQAAEFGMADIEVELFRDVDGDGIVSAADAMLRTARTGADGTVTFAPAATGDFVYRVRSKDAAFSFAGFGEALPERYVGLHTMYATANEPSATLPDAFALDGNYPNPFNPSTTIGFSVAEAAHVRLAVYDMLGREVAVLVDGVTARGRHHVAFDAAGLPSGPYLTRLVTPTGTHGGMMTLLK